MLKFLIAAALGVMVLAGCERTDRATVGIYGGGSGAYLPGENFANGGATRCGSVNVPPALKACE